MSATVKEELSEPSEAEEMIFRIVEAAQDGIDMDAITLMTPVLKVIDRQVAINSLLSSKRLIISQAMGGILRLKVNTNTQIAGSPEEQALRDGSGLAQLQLRKVLKTLETKKLIKSVKAVGTTKKCYMLFDLEPDMELTGGTFYSDQQLDSELINALINVSTHYVQDRHKQAVQSYPDNDQMQREMSYVRPQEIADYISEKKILNVPLKLEDLQKILDIAIVDGSIERRADGKLRASLMVKQPSALVSIPCSVCPVVEDCRPGYVISPETCEYMTQWLDAAQQI
ncbi:unnamed protein product [Caenorhabditis auriculariae]|uniref:DNA-directed RNA polymerase III subunit RPC6 n=1 Tax=Caenorhabditis auriculariae TaxID=2777116 RepID=A0A8S1HJL2_9PELO|nr:unnamed protein product [Caenorhabditis auriculariae]